MELKIIPFENPIINFNNEELKKELIENLEIYQGLVYTDENIANAKKDKADLNKLIDKLETARKIVKKQCMIPYDNFEIKAKELLTLINKPLLEIDTQVNSFVQKQKDQKQKDIETFYNENVADLLELLPLAKIFNEKWLNVSYKIKEIEGEISCHFSKVKCDIQVIENLKSEFELQVKDMYLKTFSISSALSEGTRLQEQKLKLEEYKRKQEEIKQEEIKPIEQVEIVQEVIKPIEQASITPVFVVQAQEVTEPIEELQQIDFRVFVTQSQKIALKDFFISNNIKYGSVK